MIEPINVRRRGVKREEDGAFLHKIHAYNTIKMLNSFDKKITFLKTKEDQNP